MKKFNVVFFLIGFLLFSSCSVKTEVASPKVKEFDTLEYYSVFTDATKHALLGNYKTAIKLYNQSLRINPQSAAAYFQLSSVYLKANNLGVALTLGEQAVSLDSTNYWYLLHLANIYQYSNNIPKAIACYEVIIRITDSDEDRYNLALLYNADKQYQKALDLTNELKKDSIATRDLYIMRHNIYHGMSKYDSAIYELESLVTIYPDDFENYGLLAEYLRDIHRNSYAEKVYWKLLQLEPDNGLVNISYGEFLYTLGRIDSAYIYYAKGLESSDIPDDNKLAILYNFVNNMESRPVDSTHIGNLINIVKKTSSSEKIYTLSADYNLKLKKYDLAVGDLNQYLLVDRSNELVWEQKLMILNFIDRHEELLIEVDTAIKYVDKAVFYLLKAYAQFSLELYTNVIATCDLGFTKDTLKSEIIQFHNLRADSYRELGDNPSSDKYYELILQLDPNNLMIRNNYSYYLSVRKERLGYAEELSRLTIKMEPGNPIYLDTYGWILFQLERYKEAKKYLELAIRSGAYKNIEVLDHYGDVMFKLGSCKEAIEAWTEGLKLDFSNKELFNKIADAQEDCK